MNDSTIYSAEMIQSLLQPQYYLNNLPEPDSTDNTSRLLATFCSSFACCFSSSEERFNMIGRLLPVSSLTYKDIQIYMSTIFLNIKLKSSAYKSWHVNWYNSFLNNSMIYWLLYPSLTDIWTVVVVCCTASYLLLFSILYINLGC